MGSAACNACRVQSLINAIHAEIAFHYLAGQLIELRNTPGASFSAVFAAIAQFLLHVNQSVSFADGHGASWACWNAFWFLAVQTGLILGAVSQFAVLVSFGPGNDDPVELQPLRDLVLDLAMDLTGLTANASVLVQLDSVFAHDAPNVL